jgi:hypothetical protein
MRFRIRIAIVLAAGLAGGWAAASAASAGAAAAGGSGKDVAAAVAEAIKGARTDAQRAQRLLEAGRAASEPEVVAGLLEKAVEYGVKGARAPEALKAATEAADLLDSRSPSGKDKWSALRLDVRREAWRNAPREAKAAASLDLLDALRSQASAAEAAGQWARSQALLREACSLAGSIRSPLQEMLAFQRDRAGHFEQIARQADVARKKLTDNPADGETRDRLLQMLVIELVDLGEAKKVAAADAAQAWSTYLPLAGQDSQTFDEAAATELGRWYFDFLLPKASKYSELRLLVAARGCYQRAVVLHAGQDAQRTALEKKLQEIEVKFDALAMDPAAGGRGADVDLLRSIDLDTMAWQGVWDFVGGTLTVWPRTEAYLRLPATVTGNYRLSLKFTNRYGIPIPDKFSKFGHMKISDRQKAWLARKINEKAGLDVALPLGRKHVGLSIDPDRQDAKVRLLHVDPEGTIWGATTPAEKVVSTRPATGGTGGYDIVQAKSAPLPTEKAHQVDVAVFVEEGVAAIAVDLDGRPVLRWKGKANRCSLADAWPPGRFDNAIILGGWMGPTAFTSAKVCSFRGEIRMDRPVVNEGD